MTSCGCSSELMTGQAWLKGGTFAHGAAGPPMVYFSAYSSGSAQVTAVGPTTARFVVLAAEFYVLSVLHRLGVDANLTLGNKKSVDIAAVRAAGDAITIDVKGLAGTTS